MAAPAGGEILFDAHLEIDRPLVELWAEGTPYSPLSPRKDMRRAGNLLLRQQHLEDFEGSDVSLDELQQMLDMTARHFRQLQQFGMSVVSHVTEPRADPMTYRPSYEDCGVVFSACAYVSSVRTLDKPYAEANLPRAKVQEFVVDPLERYLEWVKGSGETYMLNDVYRTDQYAWQPTTGVVFLHDIDPFYIPIDEYELIKDADIIGSAREELAEEFAIFGR